MKQFVGTHKSSIYTQYFSWMCFVQVDPRFRLLLKATRCIYYYMGQGASLFGSYFFFLFRHYWCTGARGILRTHIAKGDPLQKKRVKPFRFVRRSQPSSCRSSTCLLRSIPYIHHVYISRYMLCEIFSFFLFSRNELKSKFESFQEVNKLNFPFCTSLFSININFE